MRSTANRRLPFNAILNVQPRAGIVLAALCLALGGMSSSASDENSPGGMDRERPGAHKYAQVNLVSDVAGAAMVQNTNLVNAWGLSSSATSPFWVSANGTGKALVYAVTNDVSGAVHVTKLGLEVTIPGDGSVTGQVFNNKGGFHGDVFLFASEDGTISGWRNALGTTAEILATRPTASYKGLTLAEGTEGPVLLAANFTEGTVDAYDTNAHLVARYADPRAPDGYAPFNVQSVGDMVFVNFALRKEGSHDDAAGPGHGLIDVFDARTGVFHRFATGSGAGGKLRQINSPWGIALAPASFGKHADQLLVGNFGSGTIMAFEADGKFKGLLEDERSKPIVIEGLWGLAVGNGGRAGVPDTVYFTAGPDDEGHGLFGSLDLVARHGK